MKTIAVSIDESTLQRLDRRVKCGSRQRTRNAKGSNRSQLVRAALRLYLDRTERGEQDARDADAYARHRRRLDEQLDALVAEQDLP